VLGSSGRKRLSEPLNFLALALVNSARNRGPIDISKSFVRDSKARTTVLDLEYIWTDLRERIGRTAPPGRIFHQDARSD
jgi:hypothetical protein